MFKYMARKIFGTENDRYLKRISPFVDKINGLESSMSALDDVELQAKTAEFRQRIENGAPLDSILPEAFAVAREAGKRVLGMRHYDVQLIGGMVLHQGRIAEMKTGEGKTLVATLPMYLNGLTGKGAHLVTVNDYLARRDAEWMGKLYRFLGLSTGVIVNGLKNRERREAYACDITYGTNNEFGFDYLRDNMKFDLSQYVQRPLNFAIVDEVDSILIDEARTPLIISGPSEASTEAYYHINSIMHHLKDEEHFTKEEKSKNAILTSEGIAKVESLLGIENLYAPENLEVVHHVQQALKAHFMFHRDVDYVVKESKVMIVDEFTGRLMDGRRYSDGLHQALEAKEGVNVESENQTLATITFQNYFRMYDKLSGMTGTADTEASEFADIYNLNVTVIPTNRPIARKDDGDVIYKTQWAKEKAIVREISEKHKNGQPVLVGTISVEKSERLHQLLEKENIPHSVLNAKYHLREAEIVAQAGQRGAVTIATNMAGRGTDIVLGGNPEMLAKAEMKKFDLENNPEAIGEKTPEDLFNEFTEKFREECDKEKKEVLSIGGLHIIGTERHESRRIDNQLRGRSGRQGDPGSSRFFLCLEDDLLRIFGSDRISKVMDRLGIDEEEPIEHKWISKAIENAQKKVESHNFGIRKNVLEYDDVMNQQRKTVYSLRRDILGEEEDNRELVYRMIEETVNYIISSHIPEGISPQNWDFDALTDLVSRITVLEPEMFAFLRSEEVLSTKPVKDSRQKLAQMLYDFLVDRYSEKIGEFDEELSGELERHIILEVLDFYWRRHLLDMDHLREGIGLRGYGQKNPKLEYKKEGFRLFTEMMVNIYTESVKRLFSVQVVTEDSVEKMEKKEEQKEKQIQNQPTGKEEKGPAKRVAPKVGRNDPCPCGSGKKFKKCCMGKGVFE